MQETAIRAIQEMFESKNLKELHGF